MNIKDNTHFIFVAISSKVPEPDNEKERFIKDIFHCVFILQQKGVDGGSISIISDWPSSDWEKHGFPPIHPIMPADAYKHIESIDTDNLIIVSSCHGGINGIGTVDGIKPNELITAIKTNQRISNCVVFFGQCYAGVFNYTNVSDENKKIVYIGATGMRSGLSTLMQWNITPTNPIKWSANISVYYMFEWIDNPVDVDNDGQYSVMDLYKYVSFKTNEKTELLEKVEEHRYLNKKIQLELVKCLNNAKPDLIKLLDSQALVALNNYIIPHQDCWILNAIPASSMYFEFSGLGKVTKTRLALKVITFIKKNFFHIYVQLRQIHRRLCNGSPFLNV